MTEYPVPSYHRNPNRIRTTENEQLDFGWSRGTMRDGRAFYAEYWNEFGIDVMTWYFSTQGLETMDTEQLGRLLEAEGLIRYPADSDQQGRPRLTSAKRPDEAGQEMWLVNVPFADEDEIWVDCLSPIQGYGSESVKGNKYGN